QAPAQIRAFQTAGVPAAHTPDREDVSRQLRAGTNPVRRMADRGPARPTGPSRFRSRYRSGATARRQAINDHYSSRHDGPRAAKRSRRDEKKIARYLVALNAR